MAETAKPAGPFKLVTVNTAPERAKKLIGRLIESVKDTYTIIHCQNVTGELARFDMTGALNTDFRQQKSKT